MLSTFHRNAIFYREKYGYFAQPRKITLVAGDVFSIKLKPFGTFGGATDIYEACRLRIFYRNTPNGFRQRNGGGVFIDFFIEKTTFFVGELLASAC